MDERVGAQIGHYRLVRRLGQGEFADVYLGEHLSLKSLAAIKLLHTTLDNEEMQNFLAQAQAIEQLKHPHIVRVLGYGVEHAQPFIVTAYEQRGNLRQLHPRGTKLPLFTIISYIRQIAEALQYIHDQQLIHRDIKPHNMLVGLDGKILVSDFDILAVAQQIGYRRYKTRDFEGTILYAAPEQLRGRARYASDQYALAVVVYEWLSGEWPFQGSVEQIARQHLLEQPPSLREKLPSLPPAFEQIVMKALAKDPNQRFETVQEFSLALERASRPGQSTFITRPFPSPLPTPVKATEPTRSYQLERPALIYRLHTDKVHMLAWAPHPRQQRGSVCIASSSLDETIRVWDAESGSNLLVKRSNALQEQVLAWSPDGHYIASTSDLLCESVQIWESLTGNQSLDHVTYVGHTGKILALAWSPDSRYIASGGDDGTVQVWEVSTGRALAIYRGHRGSVKAIAWSPDAPVSHAYALTAQQGSRWRIVSGGEDKTAQVWDALTGSNVKVYYTHAATVNALAWAPGGAHIASASDDTTVHVWDAAEGHRRKVYDGHTREVTSVAWSPDGTRIVSGSMDETVRVWDAIIGTSICSYGGHNDWVSTVAWSPDGRSIASGSWDKTVHVWTAQ